MATSMLLLLEKITSKDKDFRYMATSDLLTELQKDTFRTDPETEKKLCAAMLNQLEDTSGDISGLAVRCLALLVRKVGEGRALDLVNQLADKAVAPPTKKEAARDVASIALKSCLGEVAGMSTATPLAQAIVRKMLLGVTKEQADVVSDSLEVLGEVLDRCGGMLGQEHVTVRDALLPFLDDLRAPVRKRALQCLAFTSMYLNDEQLAKAVSALLQRLKAGGLKPDFVRTYVQALGHISRTVGYRFGKFLPEAVPLVISCCKKASEADDELREFCLQALEGFVVYVPLDAKQHVDSILDLCFSLIKYDPNVAGDDDEAMEEDEAGDEEEDEEEDEEDAGSDEGYSDDEDVSWKVRRAAVKALAAVLLTYPDLLPDLYDKTSAVLLSRLVGRNKEREESVRGDVFGAFVTLVRQVGAGSGRFARDDPINPVNKLASSVPDVARAMSKQLKERSLKSRVGGLQLLRELAAVVPAPTAAQLPVLLPGITASLSDKSSAASALKIEALMFVRAALAAGPQGAAADAGQLRTLIQAVVPCASDRYYKVAAEAVRVLEQVVVVARPLSGGPAALDPAQLQAVFAALQARLGAPDQDQEVKEAAISAAATAAACCADVLGTEVQTTLRVLLERLRNEITRLAAVRGFNTLATSPLPLDLAGAGVLEPMWAELTSFLRKALRPLRLAALLALEAVCAKYGRQLPVPLLAGAVEEASLLISDADLALAAQALKTLSVLLRVQPQAAPAAAQKALPAALVLVRSPLLQGAALDQLNAFLTALAASHTQGASVDDLLAALQATGKAAGAGGAAPRGAQLAVAQCVAVLASCAGQSKVADTAQGLLGDVGAKSDPSAQRLALLCLGELGRRVDLSKLPQVESSISSSLASDSEDIKGAASLALGGVACGNLTHYMPSLLRQIQGAANPKQHYLLLTALNEVLTTCSTQQPAGPGLQGQPGLEPAPVPQLSTGDQASALQLLLASAEGAQEESKLVIAECLGRLALLQPQQVLEQLRGRLQDQSVNMRVVVVSSLKYMMQERPHPIDAPLAAQVGEFLAVMADPSHHVRRAVVVSLSAMAHQKPRLVATGRDGAPPPLQQVLPLLYEQTAEREDLIRTVDLGPFKHRIDDGLELRKAAFECLDILLDTPACYGLLDIPIFIKHLAAGLKDHVDIKAPCHLMLAKLCGCAPVAVLAGAEALVPALESTLNTRLKSDAVKQEVDRHEDMLRSCLRAVHAMALLPGVEGCGPFNAFMKRAVLVAPIKDKYAQVEKEWADADSSMMMDTK